MADRQVPGLGAVTASGRGRAAIRSSALMNPAIRTTAVALLCVAPWLLAHISAAEAENLAT